MEPPAPNARQAIRFQHVANALSDTMPVLQIPVCHAQALVLNVLNALLQPHAQHAP
jgi:hypothetical protein